MSHRRKRERERTWASIWRDNSWKLPYHGKETITQVQEVQRATVRISLRWSMQRHAVIRLTKNKDKRKKWKATKGKATNSYKRITTRLSVDSLAETADQRRQRHQTPVLLPGKSHGWRSLVGCSPWGHEELDTTERLHFHFSLSCTGEGNGNPLQCSCLESPRDRGAWWAAIYGVAQSQTRLKWLSSSSSRPEWSGRLPLKAEREEPESNTVPSKALTEIWRRNQKLYRQAKTKRIQHH